MSAVANIARAVHGRPTSRRAGHRHLRPVSSLLMIVFLIVMILPVFIMLSSSLRSNYDSGARPLGLPTHPQWSNYVAAFHSMDYLHSVLNTLIITVGSIALVVVAGSLCAYAVARHARRWTHGIYRLFLLGLTVPVFVLLTPLYFLMHQLHLLNTYWSVMLGYAALNLPLAVFFYSSVISAIPIELEQAAAVDGCTPMRTFWRVVFPLLRPGTVTLAILAALNIWNDLVLPLLFLDSPSLRTVTLSVYSFIGTEEYQPSQLFPAVVLAFAPLLIIFLILQRQIIAGITAGIGKT